MSLASRGPFPLLPLSTATLNGYQHPEDLLQQKMTIWLRQRAVNKHEQSRAPGKERLMEASTPACTLLCPPTDPSEGVLMLLNGPCSSSTSLLSVHGPRWGSFLLTNYYGWNTLWTPRLWVWASGRGCICRRNEIVINSICHSPRRLILINLKSLIYNYEQKVKNFKLPK